MLPRAAACYSIVRRQAGCRSQRWLSASTSTYAQQQQQQQQQTNGSTTAPQRKSAPNKILATVSTAAKTTSNMGILVAGVVVFGTLAYYIGTELLGTTSPSAVYARTVDILRQHPAVVAIFDSDFNCHTDPEQGHRRRSRQISHRIVENLDGERRMIMQFYIDNSQRQAQGVVHVEMVQSADGGEWRYAALSVDARHVSGHSKRIVIVN